MPSEPVVLGGDSGPGALPGEHKFRGRIAEIWLARGHVEHGVTLVARQLSGGVPGAKLLASNIYWRSCATMRNSHHQSWKDRERYLR